MASFPIFITFLLCLGCCLCSPRDKCKKMPEQKKCQLELVVAKKEFCKQLDRLRRCFMDEAGCSSEYFYNLKKTTEESLNVKCGSCVVLSSLGLWATLAVAILITERR